MSMYGIEGRVVPGAIAVAGYSVSSVSELKSLRAGEPARGVMGGLSKPTTPSVVPAPIGVLAGVVSPRTSAVVAAVSVEPAGRTPVKKSAG